MHIIAYIPLNSNCSWDLIPVHALQISAFSMHWFTSDSWKSVIFHASYSYSYLSLSLLHLASAGKQRYNSLLFYTIVNIFRHQGVKLASERSFPGQLLELLSSLSCRDEPQHFPAPKQQFGVGSGWICQPSLMTKYEERSISNFQKPWHLSFKAIFIITSKRLRCPLVAGRQQPDGARQQRDNPWCWWQWPAEQPWEECGWRPAVWHGLGAVDPWKLSGAAADTHHSEGEMRVGEQSEARDDSDARRRSGTPGAWVFKEVRLTGSLSTVSIGDG